MADQEVSKRSVDEGSGGEQMPSHKRAKGEGPHVTMRFLIQSKSAGAIIGRSGANIKRLRSEYEAEVAVPDCNGPERILTVSGAMDNVLGCMEEILPIFEDAGRGGGRGGRGGGRGGSNDGDGRREDTEVRMLVHQSSAGAIIGRAGFKIKELREKAKCVIKVYTELCPNSFERVVQFNGTVDTVLEGIKEILNVVQEAPIKGPTQLYDPFCHDDDMNYGGHQDDYYGGGGGGGRRGPPAHFSAFPPMMQPMRGGPRRMGGGGGPGGRIGGGMRNGGGGRRDGAGGGGGRRPQGGRREQEGYDFSMDRFLDDLPFDTSGGSGDGEITSTQVTIPKQYAGAIIGHHGDRIREIRRISTAQIKIDEPLPGSSDRIITITGTEEAITNAQYLLQNSVRNHSGGNKM